MPSKVDQMTGGATTSPPPTMTSAAALSRPRLADARPEPKQNPEAALSEPSTTDDDAGAHLDDILVEDTPRAEYEPAPIDPHAGLIDKDEFFRKWFCGVFELGALPGPFPLPLETLPIKPEEEAVARPASDALYEVIAKVGFLRFILEPGNQWVERAYVIAMFALYKGRLVMAEIAAKHEARRAEAARDVSPGRQSERPPTSDADAAETQTL